MFKMETIDIHVQNNKITNSMLLLKRKAEGSGIE